MKSASRVPTCRTRFAPSPTGSMHIGSLRTAAYAYALAKHSGGEFILRIEDTDKKREVVGALGEIKETLQLFGLKWDEYYVQSERVKKGVYKETAEKLVAAGHAYRDEGAIRIKIPKGETVSYRDFVLGKEVSWKTEVLEELVLLKSDGFPTYHLAVVVDDHDMGITHVLRGHDWMPSTPIHLLLYKFLGYDLPQIGHLTDILDPEGGKLSKRKGSTSVAALLAEGYLPEAILNFVILLGWAPKDNQEIFSLGEFVKKFDPRGFQKANPVLNREKLDWFNGHYIRQKSDKEVVDLLKPYLPKMTTEVAGLIKDRIKKLADAKEFASFFWEVDKQSLALRARKLLGKNYKEHLAAAREAIESGQSLEEVPGKRNFKVGDFFMDLRIAITGSKFTPPINESIEILGKDESLARLKNAI